MLISTILQKLPASLEWMVLFKLETLAGLADDDTVRAMFFLPGELCLEGYSHVILSSAGHLLAPQAGPDIVLAQDQSPLAGCPQVGSLAGRFSAPLQLFPVDEADCLGLGEQAPWPPVLLYLQAKAGYAQAKALFCRPPSLAHYELLTAVGIKFLGGSQQGPYYLAEFSNRLPVHLHAGILAHFTRTGHCNQFFLQHGNIDFRLATGLAQAARDRVAWARERTQASAAQLGRRAGREPLAMTCRPPSPAGAYLFGDLVPLGLLLKALPRAGTSTIAGREVEEFLLARRQGQLWAFHTGRLVTATDSALILHGLVSSTEAGPSDARPGKFAGAVEALEVFADGQGGYYPQLWQENGRQTAPEVAAGTTETPQRMWLSPANRHWCQPDYATTCLVRSLRLAAGLPAKTSPEYLAVGFETRSGLYFANPYLVDWALAMALAGDEAPASETLRQRLLAEILGSMNEDYSFGGYDPALSTALAILSLASLGYRGRTMRLAQLRLADFMEGDGRWPEAVPFYSTLFFDHARLPAQLLFHVLLNDTYHQVIQAKGRYYAISFYWDSHRMITTGLAGLALSEKCMSASRDPELKDQPGLARQPRYQCSSHSAYIAGFALPPYLKEADNGPV
jgi:hypothetical protein